VSSVFGTIVADGVAVVTEGGEYPRGMLIATERLILRRFRKADAPVLAEYRSDPDFARYQSWEAPFPLMKAETAVGDVAVRLHENLMQAEIGFTLATPYQSKGFAAEAVGAVLDRLFRVQGLHKVTGECDARNVRSAALMERLGFTREGHLRQQTFIKGEWTDDLIYGLLAAEWIIDQKADEEKSGR
jgi:RimJ/RimL family protein N-acetyltransferase